MPADLYDDLDAAAEADRLRQIAQINNNAWLGE